MSAVTNLSRASWSQLVLHDALAFVRFFGARWLGLLGAWNSLFAPMLDLPALSPLTAAIFVVGYVFGLILVGDDD